MMMRETKQVKDCEYPNCEICSHQDCDVSERDIAALLKRRRWNANPELYRQKQRDYRSRVMSSLPHCDECKQCVFVKKAKDKGDIRLCLEHMQLVEQKVTSGPRWCTKREKMNNN